LKILDYIESQRKSLLNNKEKLKKYYKNIEKKKEYFYISRIYILKKFSNIKFL